LVAAAPEERPSRDAEADEYLAYIVGVLSGAFGTWLWLNYLKQIWMTQ
jgi:hypothetical protein